MRTNFPKALDKFELMFYNNKQNKRAEHLCKAKKKIALKGMIYMTTSNAKNLDRENMERKITVTTKSSQRRSDKSLRPQKLTGSVVLAVSLAAVVFGGELSAAAVMIPPALAAIFSKEKLLDFGIFRKN